MRVRSAGRTAGAALAFLPLWGAAHAALADPAPALSPAAEAVSAVLDAHCGSCHQRELLDGRPAGGGLANILELDQVVRDPSLVIPGLPDGSRLYNRMLSGHIPGDVYGIAQGGKGPTPEEIQQVRDWIAGLEVSPAKCPSEPAVAAAQLKADMDRWLAEMGAEARVKTRFVSLAPVLNACLGDAMAARYRRAAETLIMGLSTAPKARSVETVGDLSALLAVQLDEAGIAEARWEEVARSCPGSPGAAIPAHCLAAVAPLAAGSAGLGDALTLAIKESEIDLDAQKGATQDLARRYTRDLDLKAAAAEAMLPPDLLIGRLEAASGADKRLVQRLAQGLVQRTEWERLMISLGLSREPGSVPFANEANRIDIGLTSERLNYKTGDLAVFEVTVSASCNLTLIEIDAKGEAIVLFPNDFEQSNALSAGQTKRIPAENAAYQLRLDHAGEETVLAICQRIATRPEGIGHDFEHRRFTHLGNWRDQVRLSAEREVEWKQRMADLARFKRRVRSKGQDATPPPPPAGPEIEGRAAIRFRVEEITSPSARAP